ncbi:MAG TPA: SDR family oxidoreductase [Acidimicrobiia bacterium]|nr:SDR family oxidoreductase [Acidimicrobiia bacterium]
MRVRLESLPSALQAALARELQAEGHDLAGDPADALVVGLGATPPATRFLDLGPDVWEASLAGARRALRAARDVAAGLVAREAPGRIVFVIDPPAVRAVDGMTASAVPGAFLTTVAQVAAAELGPRGVTANVVVAGWTRPAPEGLAASIPLGRLADPDELAAACAFLLSVRAAYVTGTTLVADGGFHITKASGANPLWRAD